jgi:hypothetical protein
MHTPLLDIIASAQDAEGASGTESLLEAGALKEALHEDGSVTAVDPAQVVALLAKFSGNDLTGTLSGIERSVRGLSSSCLSESQR